MQPGIYTDLSSEQYHAADGISNSGLRIISERTPAHYFASLHQPRIPTPAMLAGSRLHLAALEPELFTQTYGVMPKADMRTKEGKQLRADWEGLGFDAGLHFLYSFEYIVRGIKV